jgi:hypothetical protein
MRSHAIVIGVLLVFGASPSAERPAQQEMPKAPAATPLPVKRVVLYKTGVGYFEHLGNVRNDQNITIRFTSAQLNDVLKSLTAIDLGKGQISSVSYSSVAPLEQRLGGLRLPVGEGTTSLQLLGTLRGARVEVTSVGTSVNGRLLSVEQRERQRTGDTTTVDVISIVTDAGELRTFELTPAVRVRIVERDLRHEIGRYLDVVGSTREQDVRNMVISTTGSGDRPLFVSYISEVPVWKSTYRLVIPKDGKALLQGWAIVDNTIGEDWSNVELSLVAGAPQSFIQQLSQPFYTRRPVVPVPSNVMLAPQTHAATLEKSTGAAVAGQIEGVSESVVIVNQNDIRRPPAPPAPPAMPFAGAGRGVAGGVVGGVVGGLPAAYDQLKALEPAATGADLGDLFEYRIKEPITLRKNQSALVPIINAGIGAEKVSLWNRQGGSGRPLRALWLTNSTGLTLDGGSMTVIDAEAFAGEGLVEPIKPGEKRFVSYAADLGLLVSTTSDTTPRRIFRARARDGVLITETEERINWTYKVRSEAATPSTVIVEHAVRPGWKLAEGQTSVENTPQAHRFRVIVDPGKEATLGVREVMAGTSRLAISDVTEQLIVQLAASGLPAAELERALKPVLDRKAELAAIERRLQSLESLRTAIVQDQQRLRENMKALRGSTEEKELLQRYTRQLNEQENRLESLQQEIAKGTAERESTRSALSAAIGSLSFEIG